MILYIAELYNKRDAQQNLEEKIIMQQCKGEAHSEQNKIL